MATILLTAIIVGIISGSYPVFFLSAFKPVNILKGTSDRGRFPVFFRKLLVVGQFAISIILIISSIIIYQQIHYWKNKDLGFNKKHVITLPILDNSVLEKQELLKNRLLQNPNILAVTASSMEPGVTTQNLIFLKGKEAEDVDMGIIFVDHDYIKTLEINIIEGRDFSKNVSTDAKGGLLMNQAAIKRLGWEPALGQEIELYYKERGSKFPVYQTNLAGIVQDFNFRELTMPVQPVLLKIDPRRFKYIMIRIGGNNVPKTIDQIEKTWREFHFDQPFEFTFLEDDIDNAYKLYDHFAGLIKYATFFAILIACLGLMGLASYTVERRTKEIGIRKVLGATVLRIVMMLSQSFLKWVLIANLIAWPIAYFLTNSLLQDFSYRINIGLLVFVLSAFFILILALATVSLQAIRAALTNPVKTLRYE
jgi:putative ABC transport system permease protein